jgi:hypothetical protein
MCQRHRHGSPTHLREERRAREHLVAELRSERREGQTTEPEPSATARRQLFPEDRDGEQHEEGGVDAGQAAIAGHSGEDDPQSNRDRHRREPYRHEHSPPAAAVA